MYEEMYEMLDISNTGYPTYHGFRSKHSIEYIMKRGFRRPFVTFNEFIKHFRKATYLACKPLLNSKIITKEDIEKAIEYVVLINEIDPKKFKATIFVTTDEDVAPYMAQKYPEIISVGIELVLEFFAEEYKIDECKKYLNYDYIDKITESIYGKPMYMKLKLRTKYKSEETRVYGIDTGLTYIKPSLIEYVKICKPEDIKLP